MLSPLESVLRLSKFSDQQLRQQRFTLGGEGAGLPFVDFDLDVHGPPLPTPKIAALMRPLYEIDHITNGSGLDVTTG